MRCPSRHVLAWLLLLLGSQREPSAAELAPAAAPPPAQLEAARSISRTFAQIAEQVAPSVVFVSAQRVRVLHRFAFGLEILPQLPFFFGAPLGPPDAEEDQRRTLQQDSGSGVVLDENGHILASHHVVAGAREITVRFIDGRKLSAKLVGTDPYSDVAVLAVDARGYTLRPARLGDSAKLEVGEWVLAVGSPFGLDHTITAGVLSAKDRAGIGAPYIRDLELLQTDAATNPGSSGGPLVNLSGEVVGINTAIIGPGSSIGIGFAVPSATAKPIIQEILRTGRVKRGYTGILMQELTPELARALGSPDKGVLVLALAPGASAAKAGVKRGDVIVKIDGRPVSDSHAVQRCMLSHSPGDVLALELWRQSGLLAVSVRATEPPAEEGTADTSAGGEAKSAPRRLGLRLQTLNPQLAERLDLAVTQGVLIEAVRFDGTGAQAGLERGDVILEVDRQPARDAVVVNERLSEARPGGHLLLVQREELSFFATIQPPGSADSGPNLKQR